MRSVEAPLSKGVHVRSGQLLQLHEFGELLEKGMLVAANAADDERHLEGDYWLALLVGGAFECPADMVHATDVFEEGWLVVRVKWYRLKQISERGYVLLSEERVVPVMSLVRLLGLAFSNSYAAKRVLRSAVASGEGALHFLDEDTNNLILSACRHEVHEGPAE